VDQVLDSRKMVPRSAMSPARAAKKLVGDPRALSRALEEIRFDR